MTLIHVNIPRGHYIGQTRPYGHRRWNTVTVKCKSPTDAMARAVRKMAERDKRARVLFICDSGWYEPTLVMECSR